MKKTQSLALAQQFQISTSKTMAGRQTTPDSRHDIAPIVKKKIYFLEVEAEACTRHRIPIYMGGGGATGGVGGQCPSHFWDQRGTGGTEGRSNENDLCFYSSTVQVTEFQLP